MGWEVCSLSYRYSVPWPSSRAGSPRFAPSLPPPAPPPPRSSTSSIRNFSLPASSLPPSDISTSGRRGSLLQGRRRGGPPGSILLLSYALTHCKKAPGKEWGGEATKKGSSGFSSFLVPLGTESSTLSRRSEMNQSCFFCRPLLAPVLVLLVLVPKL